MMAKCESGDPRLETAIRKTVTDVAGDENCVLRKYARQHDVDGDGRKDIFVMFIVDPKYRAGSFLKYYVAFSGTRRKPQAEVLPLVEGDGVGVDCVYYDGKEFRVRVFARSVSSEGAPFPSDIERFGLRKGHLVRLSSVTP